MQQTGSEDFDACFAYALDLTSAPTLKRRRPCRQQACHPLHYTLFKMDFMDLSPIRLLLLADQLENFNQLQTLLHSSEPSRAYSATGAAVGRAEWLQRVVREYPKLLLLDFCGEIDLELVAHIHQTRPDLAIILTGDAPEEALLAAALNAGAQEYLQRDVLTPRWLRHTLHRSWQHAHTGRFHYLERIFQASPAAIAILHGPDHIYQMANPRYLQVVDRQDLIGQPVRTVLPDLAAQGFTALLDQVYRSGEAYIGREQLAHLKQPGSDELVARYFNFIYDPIRDARGQVSGIYVNAVDVTAEVLARRRTEELAERAERQRRRLRAVLEILPVGVLIADSQGKIVQSNAAISQIWGSRRRRRPYRRPYIRA
jgi:PAS domain-containing protein